MTSAQTKQFAAMAQMLIALGEQVNRMTDSMIRLNERVEKLEAYSSKSQMMLPEVPA